MKSKLLVLLTVFVCLVSGTVFSAVTGRITGVIISSETGDVVPGANVSVIGTSLGGVTNANGKYTILNVPVGNYTIRVSSVGFTTLEVSNVSVSVDLASFQDHTVSPTTEELGDVIRVTAETPLVIRDKVASISIVKRDELLALPTRGFEDIVGIQTGVVRVTPNLGPRGLRGQREATNTPELNIRGGRPSEVAYYVDGFSQQDPLSGTSTANISNNAIKEISITSGGFPAEYGHVASGIVNVTTLSGGNVYHGNAEVVTDNWHGNSYDQNWYSLDLGGPIPGVENGSFFGSVERRYHGDRMPSAITADALPSGSDRLPNNWLDGWAYQGKIDYEFTKNFKLQLSGTGSNDEWSQYIHSFLFNAEHMPYYKDDNLSFNTKLTYTKSARTFMTLSGTYFVTERFRGDGVYREDIWAYGRPGLNPKNDDEKLFRSFDDIDIDSITGDRIFTPTTFVTISADSLGTPDGLDRTFIAGGDEGHVFDDFLRRKSSYIGFKGQITSEVTSVHTLKGGFEFNRHTLRFYQHFFPVTVWKGVNSGGFQDANRYGYDLFGNESDPENFENTTKHPIDLGFFLQDRLEYEGLIITAGLRFDYFDYNALRLRNAELPLNPDSLGFGSNPPIDNLSQVFDLTDTEDSEKFTRLSPRLGVAFPISDKTQMRLSYGRFYQRPDLKNLYVGYDFLDFKINSGGYYVSFGNPNLKPPRTTAYEIGITRQMGDNTSIDVNLFYKDITDLIQVFTQPSFPTSFASYRNSDYGTIKGLEFRLKTRRTNQIALDFKYTLSYASGTGSHSNTQGNTAWVNADAPRQTAPLTFDQTHKFIGNFDLRYGGQEGPRLGDIYPLENFGINVLLVAASGLPYTPILIINEATVLAFAPVVSDTRNSETGPWTLTIDLKAEKSFNVGNFKLAPYFWVKNLLDRDNAVQVWEGSGRPNSTGWLETPEGQDFAADNSDVHDATGLTAEEKYQIAQNHPLNYSNPRQIYFGIRASF